MVSETLGLNAYLFLDLGDKYTCVESKVHKSEGDEEETVSISCMFAM